MREDVVKERSEKQFHPESFCGKEKDCQVNLLERTKFLFDVWIEVVVEDGC